LPQPQKKRQLLGLFYSSFVFSLFFLLFGFLGVARCSYHIRY
jgi:hypothetical protein